MLDGEETMTTVGVMELESLLVKGKVIDNFIDKNETPAPTSKV